MSGGRFLGGGGCGTPGIPVALSQAIGPAGPQGVQGVDGAPGINGIDGVDGTDGYGIVGGGTDHIIMETDIVATTSYTITTGKHALSSGPLTLNPGVEITVPPGSIWTII